MKLYALTKSLNSRKVLALIHHLDLPVEIEREFDVWRWVEDPDGNRGWVHQATLMGRRSFIVQKADATLRSDAADSAAAVAVL